MASPGRKVEPSALPSSKPYGPLTEFEDYCAERQRLRDNPPRPDPNYVSPFKPVKIQDAAWLTKEWVKLLNDAFPGYAFIEIDQLNKKSEENRLSYFDYLGSLMFYG
jgi:hypothetical protein